MDDTLAIPIDTELHDKAKDYAFNERVQLKKNNNVNFCNFVITRIKEGSHAQYFSYFSFHHERPVKMKNGVIFSLLHEKKQRQVV